MVAATIRAPGERRHAAIIMGAAVGKGITVAVVETVRGPVDLGNLGQTHDANCFIDPVRYFTPAKGGAS